MKKLLLLFIFALCLSLLSSCSTDESIEVYIPQNNSTTSKRQAPAIYGNVFTPLVRGEPCGSGEYIYTIYASTTNTFYYDMEVQAAVIKNGSFIETKVLIIRAGQHNSSNTVVFVGEPASIGSASSRPMNVFVNGQIDNNFTLQTISYNISNCFFSSGSGSNCYLSGSEPFEEDDPETTAVESPGDHDHDGVCNNDDDDDNGDGIDD